LAKGGPVHIHIAEQQKEVADCLAATGQRPVTFLYDQMPVDANWCLIHATHITPDEVAMIAKSQAVAGLCPITEANLGDGLFPAPAFVAAGGRFGVGSDSNVLIDAAEELRVLEYGQRLSLQARNVLSDGEGKSTGRSLFNRALAGGHAALGVAAQGLEAGATADLVSLDSSHPALVAATRDHILDSWIFAGGRGMVSEVWRAGRKIVSGGRHVGRDAIQARFATVLRRIMAI
jgi:formiminoglutamate deiminase